MSSQDTERKQKLMLQALKANGSNISSACKSVGIDRQTHYNWLDKFDKYKNAVREIEESVVDFVETSLMKSIKDGNVTAQIFYLKTKGKSRGYVERTEIEHNDLRKDTEERRALMEALKQKHKGNQNGNK